MLTFVGNPHKILTEPVLPCQFVNFRSPNTQKSNYGITICILGALLVRSKSRRVIENILRNISLTISFNERILFSWLIICYIFLYLFTMYSF